VAGNLARSRLSGGFYGLTASFRARQTPAETGGSQDWLPSICAE